MTMDLLTRDQPAQVQPVLSSHISFQNDLSQKLPTDPKLYPGRVVLDKDRRSEDDDEPTRRAKLKLRQNVISVEATQEYYRTPEENERLLKLKNMHIDPREVDHQLKKARIKEVHDNREHFLGMNLTEMLLVANRDPFTLKSGPPKTPKKQGGDRLRESESRGTLVQADKFQWDIEDSRRSLSQSDFRKKALQSGLYKKEPQLKRRVSRSGNSIIGINDSDDIEEQMGIAEDLESGMQKSVMSESIMEDLALSRSYSVKGRGGIIRSKSKGRLEEQFKGGIPDNESSGFGFIKTDKEIKPANPTTKEFRVQTEESDSDPFGVGKKKLTEVKDNSPIMANRKFDSGFSNSGEGEKKKELREKSYKDPLQSIDELNVFGTTSRKRTFIYELDPKIYEEVLDKNEYFPREPEIYKTNGIISKTISEGFASVRLDLKYNQEMIDDAGLKTEGFKKASLLNFKDDPLQKISSENERITKKLLNKISFAREKAYDPKYIEQILDELLVPTINEGDSRAKGHHFQDKWHGLLQQPPNQPTSFQQPTGTFLSPQQLVIKGRVGPAATRPVNDLEPFSDLYYKALQCRDSLNRDEMVSEEHRLQDMQNRVDRLRNIESDLHTTLAARRQETAKFKQRELEKVRQRLAAEKDRRELKARGLQIKEQLKATQRTNQEKERSWQPQMSGSNGSPASREREKREIVKPQPVPSKIERSRGWDPEAEHHMRVPELTEEESGNSATLLSDYPERDEKLQSISWMESVDSKQRKFTNIN